VDVWVGSSGIDTQIASGLHRHLPRPVIETARVCIDRDDVNIRPGASAHVTDVEKDSGATRAEPRTRASVVGLSLTNEAYDLCFRSWMVVHRVPA